MFCLGFGFFVSGMVRLWVGGLPRRPDGWVSGEPGWGWGRGLVGRGLVEAPQCFFIACRPKAAPLFWLFGDFRCGALLFIVIHVVIYI